MEKNSDVDDRLAKLSPDPAWYPDATGAMTKFKARRAGRSRLIWAAAVAMTACVFVIAFPEVTQRVLTPCVNACEVFFLRSAGVSRVSAADTVLTEGQAAPDFKFKDAKGADIRLSAYKGKVVLLDFWATWCGGCKVEIPWFIEFENQYKSRGLAVIGVSMDDDGWKLVRPFIEAKKMNYPVVIGDEDLAQRYGGVDSLPETLLIGRDGKVAAIHVGLTGKAIFEKKIVELLGK
jgi:peroxiredoxin